MTQSQQAKTMPLNSAQKTARRKEAQAKLGRKRRYPFLTDSEWLDVQAYIKRLRGER